MPLRTLVSITLIAACTSPALGQQPVNIALSATSGPLGPDQAGPPFNYFMTAVVNSSGHVAFVATLPSAPSGIWCHRNGALQRIARAGDPAPGVPGAATLSSLVDATPGFAPNGDILFRSSVSSATLPSDQALVAWRSTATGLAPLVRQGTPAPGEPAGTTINYLEAVHAASADIIAFGSSLSTPGFEGSSSVFWLGPSAAPFIHTRRSDQVPGAAPGTLFSSVYPQGASAQGHALIYTLLEGPAVTTANDKALWRAAPGARDLIARTGDPAPGVSPTQVFTYIYLRPVINAAGVTAFHGAFSGPSFPLGRDGVWVGVPGSLTLAARYGAQVFNAPPGLTYGFIYDSTLILGDSGHVLFRTELGGAGIPSTARTAFVTGLPGELAVVARADHRLPGLPPGVTVSLYDFNDAAINDAGEVAFKLRLTGTGVTDSNQWALWAGRPGSLKLIARTGSTLTCGDGAQRTVSDIRFKTGQTNYLAQARGLANNGWLTFSANFTDGRAGVFRLQLADCDPDIGAPGGIAGSDGALDNNDVIVFINWFFAADPRADVGEAGGLPGGDTLFDNNDFIAFITQFFEGC